MLEVDLADTGRYWTKDDLLLRSASAASRTPVNRLPGANS